MVQNSSFVSTLTGFLKKTFHSINKAYIILVVVLNIFTIEFS